uniref:NADH dehydrogenase subunit 6 n=1 Tax=Tapes dorsatus TaxID=368939 RepID=UPI00203764F6|nr:NADH dehydrogenase subunit 6 [Tapes dorsatus]URH16433.1 NADH dehydrogenase subunit 6 [Tapes dorsatus]
MEFFLVLCCLSSMNIMSRYDHPMFFGFGLLLVVVGVSGILSLYSGIYGFMVFMCIVSGVLVVFAYSVALVPLQLDKEELDEMEYKQENLYKSLGGKYMGFSLSILSVFLAFLIVTMQSFVEVGVSAGFFESAIYASTDWAMGMSIFGFLLFLVMVFCVGVASKHEGALIK